ncbi:MAG: Ig-like domain-containing protein [Limisphaerales bacterium]
MSRFDEIMNGLRQGRRLTRIRSQVVSLLVALGAATVPGNAQTTADFLIAKGQVFSQTSAAAPTLLPTGGAIFDAEAPGFGGPPLVTGGTVSIPGGGSRTLAYVSASFVFEYTNAVDTLAALDSAYPAGQYTIALNSTIIPGLTGNINLPTDGFPVVPVVNNFAAAQAVNATNSFTLSFQPFTGAVSPDDATITVYDNGTQIFSEALSLTASDYTISANTLAVAKTYDARIRFRHLQVTQTGLVPSAFGFSRENRFPIVTVAGTSTDHTPPVLKQATPPDGGAEPSAFNGLGLEFSKAMDHGRIAIQWAATLNGAPYPLASTNFAYDWTDTATLVCSYSPLTGGWPPGLVVTWTLSPTLDSTSNFADLDGNLLAVDTYSGRFVTFGGPWNCLAQIADPLEAPAYYLAKTLNYIQTSDGAPFVDGQKGAHFLAYYKDPGSVYSPIVAVTVPVINSPSRLIKPFALNTSPTTGTFFHWFSDTFSAGSDLDTAYPAGSYVLQLAALAPSGPYLVTNSATLVLASLGYPPIPHFSNSSAAQSLVVTNDFTLTWDAYASADINADFVQLRIFDSSSNAVFTAPNACTGITLPVTATSVTIPANTLASNQTYTAVLSFGVLVSAPQVMDGIPGQGFSALQRTTRMGINGALQLPPSPPVVAILSPAAGDYVSAGSVTFQVTASDTNAALSQLQLLNGTSLLSTVTVPVGQSNYTGTLTGTFPAGMQSATVVATDGNGQLATAGPLIFIAQDPSFVIQFSTPTNGAIYRAFSTIPLLVTATSPSGAIAYVDFFMDGNWIGRTHAPPFAWSVRHVAPGPHQFYAQAQDSAKFNGRSPTITVTVAPPDLAPDDLTNKFLGLTITAGTAPFASGGGYQLFTSVLGTNYNVLGKAGAGLSSGTYAYTKTGTNSAVIALADPQAGSGFSLQLKFNTATTGNYTLTDSTGGSQTGTFVLAPRLPVNVPGLFSLGDANGPFQLYVAGQAGVIYAAESSADLNHWSGLGKLSVTNLTTSINDTSPPHRPTILPGPAGLDVFRARLDCGSDLQFHDHRRRRIVAHQRHLPVDRQRDKQQLPGYWRPGRHQQHRHVELHPQRG